MKPLAIVVAVAKNGVIGQHGKLPWHIPEDLKHFRRITTGHAIIMGRKTFESIGRPLPQRRNIVVSSRVELVLPGAEVVPNLELAVERARESDEEPRVVGGATLYAQALAWATTLYVTEVDRDVSGDTFFPSWNRAEWEEVERRAGEDAGVHYLTLVRR